LPVVVRDVEDRVLSRARQHAERCGVSGDAMEAIFQAIIRSSVERQHRVGVALRAERGGRVLIVGGAGGMGTWLHEFLGLVGHRVDLLDTAWAGLPPAPGRFSAIGEVPDLDVYDHIVVSVPLGATPAVLDEVVARRPSGIVVEIASIKAHLGGVLARARAAGVRVGALHPMFGPGKSPYDPLTFVLACQADAGEERARIEALLRHPYTNVICLPFLHHDRLMGWLLGLALEGCGIGAEAGARRWGFGAAAAALVVGVAVALVAGAPGPLDGSLGVDCLATELACSAVVLAAVRFVLRRGSTVCQKARQPSVC
jgi:chorismate mutase/prephenate dehydrogenase